ncbi:MAG: metallophosphoesterase [Syntrophales bacterium]
MNFYLFAKIKVAFHPGAAANIIIIIILLLMILAPIIVRLCERYGCDTLATIMSYIGYLWMGVLFLFFVSSLLLDIYHFLIRAGAFISNRDLSLLIISPLYAFLLPLIISSGINVYGYFEAKNIRTEKITIASPKIPEAAGRVRIVQISDVHIGIIVRGERLKRIVEEVKKAQPDILVSTGDLVDGQTDNLTEHATFLSDVQPRYGKFAITGNHEFYAGLGQALAFTRSTGFAVLREEGINVAGAINIAGIDDPAVDALDLPKKISEKEVLSGLSHKHFTVLLKHRPVLEKESVGYFGRVGGYRQQEWQPAAEFSAAELRRIGL